MEIEKFRDWSLLRRCRDSFYHYPHSWALFLMAFGSALGAGLGAAIPISRYAPVRGELAIAVVNTLVGVAIAVWMSRVTRRWIHVLLFLFVFEVSALLVLSNTEAGAILTLGAFPWIGIFLGYFASRRQLLGYLVLITVSLVASVLLSPVSDLALPAGIVLGITWLTSVLLSILVTQLQRQATTDQLTGAVNRAGFFQATEHLVRNASRSGRSFTLCLIDLDGFKQVNDTRGHTAGDRVLVDVVEAWRVVLAPDDLLARFGGDEFAVLFCDCDLEHANAVMDDLVRVAPISFSFGITSWSYGEVIDEALRRADATLYRHKDRFRTHGRDNKEAL
ncbi:MAG: GGDEF domain-containing protein [Ferrimicrobium sp.]